MRTHLIFYWYVSEKGWYDVYDLHLKNLKIFANKFDKVTFVISCDRNDSENYKHLTSNTINKLRDVVKSAVFVKYENNKVLRESVYFYNEIALKLDLFEDDELIFFAHNKGVATTYVTKAKCQEWIEDMYSFNLEDFGKILKYFEKDTVCCVGTRKFTKWKAWAWLKYEWHYSGTFMWMFPRRISEMIKKNHEIIPRNDRYFSEGFLGSVLPDSEDFDVGIQYNKSRF